MPRGVCRSTPSAFKSRKRSFLVNLISVQLALNYSISRSACKEHFKDSHTHTCMCSAYLTMVCSHGVHDDLPFMHFLVASSIHSVCSLSHSQSAFSKCTKIMETNNTLLECKQRLRLIFSFIFLVLYHQLVMMEDLFLCCTQASMASKDMNLLVYVQMLDNALFRMDGNKLRSLDWL